MCSTELFHMGCSTNLLELFEEVYKHVDWLGGSSWYSPLRSPKSIWLCFFKGKNLPCDKNEGLCMLSNDGKIIKKTQIRINCLFHSRGKPLTEYHRLVLYFLIYFHIVWKKLTTEVVMFADDTILYAWSSNTENGCHEKLLRQVQKRIRQIQGRHVYESWIDRATKWYHLFSLLETEDWVGRLLL